MEIVYCGVPGSYAEEAAICFFGEQANLLTADSFRDAFERLRAGEAQRAVLPIENSSTGAIAAVYDLLGQYGFSIVGEQPIRVRHCLLVRRGGTLAQVREVLSHEQGLSQSGEFLARYPAWRQRAVYNTAAAAKMVAESKEDNLGAIASRRAAECYGLEIAAADINDKSDNITRFLIIAREALDTAGSDKISMVFTLAHSAGNLYQVLRIFAQAQMNLVKIESRPIADRNWEYRFFLDFVTDRPMGELDGLFEQVRAHTQTMRVLGCYPCATL